MCDDVCEQYVTMCVNHACDQYVAMCVAMCVTMCTRSVLSALTFFPRSLAPSLPLVRARPRRDCEHDLIS